MTVFTVEDLAAADKRFEAKVRVDSETGCWCWTGDRTQENYGVIRLRREDGTHFRTTAHRVSYVALVGPIAAGLHVDHLCYNPPCVNPAHLEPVTPAENTRRAYARKTHCKHGHEYTPENTLITPLGRRRCRACHREHVARTRLTPAGEIPATVQHGTNSTYVNWNCRCESCRAARRNRDRQYRRARGVPTWAEHVAARRRAAS